MNNPVTSFNMIDAELDFAVGNEESWNNIDVPIPKDVLVITTDTLKFRQGTGTLLFNQLPDSVVITPGIVVNKNLFSYLASLLISEDGDMIVIKNGLYHPSNTLVSDLSESVAAISVVDISQNTNLNFITQQFTMVNPNING